MDFNVLIIGTDANAYYLARCFHELYRRTATLVGTKPLPYTTYSRILRVRYFADLWTEIGFLNAIFLCKKELGDKKTLLIASNETYAGFIAKNREKLIAENFVFNYPSAEIIRTLMYKDCFYKTYAESGLALPQTAYYDCVTGGDIPEFSQYPIIVKPADVISYNHLSFDGKNKIYKVESAAELEQTVRLIQKGGYRNTLILQEFIPGDDSYLFDSVVYCDKNHRAKLVTLAQIGLQEHTRSMVGNAAVLINGRNPFGGTKELTAQITAFAEKIGYCGFAEFDLKYDRRDGKFKVLEINARQGRCSYYITALGCNPVEILVADLIGSGVKDYGLLDDTVLLSFVPKGVAKKYIQNRDYVTDMLRLWQRQKPVNPLIYKADRPLKRQLYLCKRALRYMKDYKNGYWKVD